MDFLLGIHFLRRNISLPRLPPRHSLDNRSRWRRLILFLPPSPPRTGRTTGPPSMRGIGRERREREGRHRTKTEKGRGRLQTRTIPHPEIGDKKNGLSGRRQESDCDWVHAESDCLFFARPEKDPGCGSDRHACTRRNNEGEESSGVRTRT